MTAEELSDFIDVNIDAIIADLITKNYYVKQKITSSVLDASYMVSGYMKIIDAHGIPQAGLRIKVETKKHPQTIEIDGKMVQIGASNTFSAFELNVDGELNIPFIKNSKVIIHVENGLSRELVVPENDFDIFSISSSDSDGYGTPMSALAPTIRRS